MENVEYLYTANMVYLYVPLFFFFFFIPASVTKNSIAAHLRYNILFVASVR